MIRLALVLLFVATPALAQNAGLEAWDKLYKVFSHPRCANCHVGPDRAPIWSGDTYGSKPRPHGMNIVGGPSGTGAELLPCTSCHTLHNSQVPHGPPGAFIWILPPVWMQWSGKSSAEICAQIKDPLRNGGHAIDQLADEHIVKDKLVAWGWHPGPGDQKPGKPVSEREIPPSSKEQVVQLLRKW